MKAILVGAGSTAIMTAKFLLEHNHDVIVIEVDKERKGEDHPNDQDDRHEQAHQYFHHDPSVESRFGCADLVRPLTRYPQKKWQYSMEPGGALKAMRMVSGP